MEAARRDGGGAEDRREFPGLCLAQSLACPGKNVKRRNREQPAVCVFDDGIDGKRRDELRRPAADRSGAETRAPISSVRWIQGLERLDDVDHRRRIRLGLDLGLERFLQLGFECLASVFNEGGCSASCSSGEWIIWASTGEPLEDRCNTIGGTAGTKITGVTISVLEAEPEAGTSAVIETVDRVLVDVVSYSKNCCWTSSLARWSRCHSRGACVTAGVLLLVVTTVTAGLDAGVLSCTRDDTTRLALGLPSPVASE